MSRNLELAFTPEGTAELQDADTDTVLWSSDDDDDFKDEFGDELLTAEKDTEEIVDYLVEHDEITQDEADKLEVFVESEGETFEGE